MVTHVAVLGKDIRLSGWQIEQSEGTSLQLVVSVQATENISPDRAAILGERLAAELARPVSLSLTVVPILRLDPIVPPTLAPTSILFTGPLWS